MDLYFKLGGLQFVWNTEKAETNRTKHGVTFEQSCEIFLDPLTVYHDAGTASEQRTSAIGLTYSNQLLFVVHIEREDDIIRIISARQATRKERDDYEDNA